MPVTINYRVVVEAEILIRFHLAGRAGQRIFGDKLSAARFKALARQWAALDEMVEIRFGDPIGLRELAGGPEANYERTGLLGAAVTRAFQRHTVFFSTHVTSRALYELAAARARTDDVHELLRFAPGAFAFAVGDVHRAIARLVDVIRSTDRHGVLHGRVASMGPEALARTALPAWRACHGVDVVARSGERYVVGDFSLLYFYRNRTSHVATPHD